MDNIIKESVLYKNNLNEQILENDFKFESNSKELKLLKEKYKTNKQYILKLDTNIEDLIIENEQKKDIISQYEEQLNNNTINLKDCEIQLEEFKSYE